MYNQLSVAINKSKNQIQICIYKAEIKQQKIALIFYLIQLQPNTFN